MNNRSLYYMAIFIVTCVFLAGCDSPSIGMQGQPATRVETDGFVFSVRRKGDLAEAMRINRVWRPSEQAVLSAADKAIRQATGCDIAQNGLTGDQAIVKARLACG